jgi:GT2 family glycosyltransferase
MSPETPVGMPRLSIIIVSFNSHTDLEACLESLTTAPPRVDHEIVVVDNASTDGTPDYLRSRWPGIRLVSSEANVGFARANNIGIRQTFGELVLLLNPDTIVPAGAVDGLVRVLDAHSDAAIAGPRIVDRRGRAEVSFGKTISPFGELRQKVLTRGHSKGVPFIHGFVERLTRRSRPVGWVSGACLLVRRQDLEAVGLMDERFFLYTEDVDLCESVRARGRKVLFEADVEIIHQRGQSAATAPAATRAAYRQSQIAFYEKHHPRWVSILKWYLKLRG